MATYERPIDRQVAAIVRVLKREREATARKVRARVRDTIATGEARRGAVTPPRPQR
jgi:hypothetical protein